MNNDNYCVILAGGRGRRLWPCSRETFPKQFIDFFGVGRTQLQQTYDRFLKIIPAENILVSTSEEYAHYVREQLPELPEGNILAEPTHRNTAPSVAWACSRIEHRNRNAAIIVAPSDQAVMQEERFCESVNMGLQFVKEHEGLLTLGVWPTRPEPGYGYIQMGDATELERTTRVKSFTEKPEREFAKMFMDSGEFLWNTGIYLARLDYFISCFCEILPSVMRNIAMKDLTLEEEQAFVHENFPRYPNLSIDYGILEKSDRVYVMQSDFGWADLGTWHSTYEAMSRNDGDNVIINSEVIADNSHNNIIKIPKDHIAVINGLDGYIVAEQGNVLLICKKEDSSALLRKYSSEVRMKYGEEYV
jgi:mannose-1-phosphate guanylyltransferase